jgi:hypothetical protein
MSENPSSRNRVGLLPRARRLSSSTVGSPAALPTVLSLPVAAWQILFFAAPLLFLIVITFWQVRSFRLEPAFAISA